MPTPRYAVGQRVDPACITPWHRGRMVREMIARTARVVRKLRLGGYACGGGVTGRGRGLPAFNKDQIRVFIRVVDRAECVEIAGLVPTEPLVVGFVASQCYLERGQSHGGVDYRYLLLFRWTNEAGNAVVYIHPEPILYESSVRLHSAPERPTAGGASFRVGRSTTCL
jgi:hypothetical protein